MNLSVAYLKKKEEWREEVTLEVTVNIAMSLLQKGLSVEAIAEATGLSIETIEKLRDRL
jgi:predicted transposase YdaD